MATKRKILELVSIRPEGDSYILLLQFSDFTFINIELEKGWSMVCVSELLKVVADQIDCAVEGL